MFSVLQPHLLHSQTRVTWKKCADLPVSMVSGQTVVIGDKVYVSIDERVFRYCLPEDFWNSLPDCPVRWFGMGQLDERVLAIGGELDYSTTNVVYSFDEESQSWKESTIPPVTVPRYSPTVISYHATLIVAGGIGKNGLTSEVELFKKDIFQWQMTCSLPFPCRDMSSVFIQKTVYLLGGFRRRWYDGEDYSNRVVYAPLDSLLQKSLPPDQTSESIDPVWKTLPNTPRYGPAAATISGCLLAVGGYPSRRWKWSLTSRKEVYIYSPFTASWHHTSDLPSAQCTATTAMISPTEFLVIGGRDSSYACSHNVFKASLEIH